MAMPDDSRGLPAWTYTDDTFLALERQRIFEPSWQLVCHLNDIPEPGDFHILDILGRSLIALRGGDGVVRAFHNVCRHRGARLLEGPRGRCPGRLVCPYHAWSYGLDGRLSAVPHREDFEPLDEASLGLDAVEMGVLFGFVFVRLAPGGPPLNSLFGPYLDELKDYRLEEMQPLGRVTLRPRPVNWKIVADNYSDALHIPVAHPGLVGLFGDSYGIEARDGVHKMWGDVDGGAGGPPSVRAYRQLLPEAGHLTADKRRTWVYYRVWPNLAFDIYPDQIDFMQFIPVSASRTIIREIPYGLPGAGRQMKAARYLNWRINRQVNAEDTVLIQRVQAGMASGSYRPGPLARTEVCLRDFAGRIRDVMPEARRDSA